MKTERVDIYFDEPGPQNTEDVIETVAKRIKATGIGCVVVASHSGATALKFSEKLRNNKLKAKVLCVTSGPARKRKGKDWPSINQEMRKKLIDSDVIIVERAMNVFEEPFVEDSRWPSLTPGHIIREVFYALGQGFKVAVEVALMAVVSGYLEPMQEVIAVGGTGKGCDTAIIMKTIFPQTFFSNDPNGRLEIREVIAMPRVKKFW
jgi:hypothetical protein